MCRRDGPKDEIGYRAGHDRDGTGRYHLHLVAPVTAPLSQCEGELEDCLEEAFDAVMLADVVLVAHQLLTVARRDARGMVAIDVTVVAGPVMIEVTYSGQGAGKDGADGPGLALGGLAEHWGRSHHVGHDVLWALIQ